MSKEKENEGAAKDPAANDTEPLHWDLRSKVGEWDPKCKDAGRCRAVGVRNVQSPLTFDLGMRLGTWDSELSEACSQLAGECGGTWVASGAKGGPVGRAPIFTLDLAAVDDGRSPPDPNSPTVRIVPSVSKKLVLASRDKDSLIEEIIDLKRAVQDQQQHLRMHKIQASIIEMENRKMILDIKDMEKPNCQSKSPKPQGTVRLRAKIAGLKTKMEVLQEKAEHQSDEINRLRQDARISRTREIEFERDVFAGEIARLTLLVKKLKQLCNHAATLEDRTQIEPMRSKVKGLEEESKKLEDDRAKLEKEMGKTEHTLKMNRNKAGEDLLEARLAEKKCRDLEHKNIRMAAAIERTKKQNRHLANELSKAEKALRKAKGALF